LNPYLFIYLLVIIIFFYQISEVVSSLPAQQSTGIAELVNVADVGVEERRVGTQDDEDQRGQELVR
jgi:hypothetical protein